MFFNSIKKVLISIKILFYLLIYFLVSFLILIYLIYEVINQNYKFNSNFKFLSSKSKHHSLSDRCFCFNYYKKAIKPL